MLPCWLNSLFLFDDLESRKIFFDLQLSNSANLELANEIDLRPKIISTDHLVKIQNVNLFDLFLFFDEIDFRRLPFREKAELKSIAKAYYIPCTFGYKNIKLFRFWTLLLSRKCEIRLHILFKCCKNFLDVSIFGKFRQY